MPGLELAGRWRNSSDGSEFSACELDFDRLVEEVRKSTDIAIRPNFLKDAPALFDRLAAAHPAAAPDGAVSETPGPASVAVFSPDGRRLLTGDDKRVLLWDVRDERLLWSRTGAPRLAGFSADGRVAALMDWNSVPRSLSSADGSPRPTRSLISALGLAKNYADGERQLVTASVKLVGRNEVPEAGLSADCTGKSYLMSDSGDLGSEEEAASAACRFQSTDAGGVARREKALASSVVTHGDKFSLLDDSAVELSLSLGDEEIVFVSSRGAAALRGTPVDAEGRTSAAAVAPGGKAALLAAGRHLTLWDVGTRTKLASWTLPSEITVLAFSPDGLKAAVGLAAGEDGLRLLAFEADAKGPKYGPSATLSRFGRH